MRHMRSLIVQTIIKSHFYRRTFATHALGMASIYRCVSYICYVIYCSTWDILNGYITNIEYKLSRECFKPSAFNLRWSFAWMFVCQERKEEDMERESLGLFGDCNWRWRRTTRFWRKAALDLSSGSWAFTFCGSGRKSSYSNVTTCP